MNVPMATVRCDMTASVVLCGVFANTRRPRPKTVAKGSFAVSQKACALGRSPPSMALITRFLNTSDLGSTFHKA